MGPFAVCASRTQTHGKWRWKLLYTLVELQTIKCLQSIGRRVAENQKSSLAATTLSLTGRIQGPNDNWLSGDRRRIY